MCYAHCKKSCDIAMNNIFTKKNYINLENCKHINYVFNILKEHSKTLKDQFKTFNVGLRMVRQQEGEYTYLFESFYTDIFTLHRNI